MSSIKLSIKENSIDFLKEALNKALDSAYSQREWKFAIFSLVQSIELALKERLRIEHPSLIYNDVDKPTTTVSLEKATIRLENIANIKLNEKDLKNIRAAASIRNYIVHHEFDLNLQQIESIFGKLVGFLKDFFEEHLNIKIAEVLEKELWDAVINAEIVANKLYDRAMDKISSKNINPKFIMSCPKCFFNSFVWLAGEEKCYLCDYEEEISICQECGLIIFVSEAHTVSYGKWRNGKNEEVEWFPDLCDDCFQEYIFKADEPKEYMK
jgi:hypothetical protein